METRRSFLKKGTLAAASMAILPSFAKTFEKSGITVISGDIRDIGNLITEGIELLVIGSPVFYYDTLML